MKPREFAQLTISSGQVSDYVAGSRGAWFQDGTLVVRGLQRLLEEWDAGATGPGDLVVGPRLEKSLGRLERRHWLEVERHGDETHLRPGARLAELDPKGKP